MARDKFHNAVKKGLIKDGWTITDDYKPSYGEIEVQLIFDRERRHHQYWQSL